MKYPFKLKMATDLVRDGVFGTSKLPASVMIPTLRCLSVGVYLI